MSLSLYFLSTGMCRSVFISLISLRPQQTSAVCSLVLKELNSGFLYPEELPSKSRLNGPYLDAESVSTFLDRIRPHYISPLDRATLGGSDRVLLTCGTGAIYDAHARARLGS